MNNEKLNLEDYGYNLSYNPDNCEGTVARIMAVHRERFEIVSEYGFSSAIIKASVNYNGGFEEYPTVGDFVIITYNPYGESLIMKTLRRKTFFERKNPTPGGGAQAVAANFDYVFIMQSLNHDINLGRIERYLSLAYESGAVPVILLTKADLCDDAQSIISEIENVAYGVGIYKISCVTGEGLEELSAYVKSGKTIVFLGSSGIGKSTLLNTLAKSDIMKVNSIREDDSKGRHTTTHRQLIRLENGAMIIDTPGMRELGMCNVTSGFSQAFDDEKADKIILPMTEVLKHPETVEIFGRKLICELPFLVFENDEERFISCLEKLKDMGVKEVLADNIGTLSAAVKHGFKVHGGHGLNVLNSVSFAEYEKLGCADITVSPEISMPLFAKMTNNAQKGILGYGFLPLMRFRACPAQTKNGCADCKGLTVIKDRLGIDFYILCSSKKYSSLLNSIPLYIGDKPHNSADFVTLYFTFENREKCRKIFSSFTEKQSLNMKKTGGLYFRELL